MPLHLSGARHEWARPPPATAGPAFVVRFTGESFATFAEYARRMDSYLKRQWVCSRTRKGPLTFEEALFSEEQGVSFSSSFSSSSQAQAQALAQQANNRNRSSSGSGSGSSGTSGRARVVSGVRPRDALLTIPGLRLPAGKGDSFDENRLGRLLRSMHLRPVEDTTLEKAATRFVAEEAELLRANSNNSSSSFSNSSPSSASSPASASASASVPQTEAEQNGAGGTVARADVAQIRSTPAESALQVEGGQKADAEMLDASSIASTSSTATSVDTSSVSISASASSASSSSAIAPSVNDDKALLDFAAAVLLCLQEYVREDRELQKWVVDDPRLVKECGLEIIRSKVTRPSPAAGADNVENGQKRAAEVHAPVSSAAGGVSAPPQKRTKTFPVHDEKVDRLLEKMSKPPRKPWSAPSASSQSIGGMDVKSHFVPYRGRGQLATITPEEQQLDRVDWWEREHALRGDSLMVYSFLNRFSKLLRLATFSLADWELALCHDKIEAPTIIVESALALLQLINPKLLSGSAAAAAAAATVGPAPTDAEFALGVQLGDFMLPARQTRSGGSSFVSQTTSRRTERARIVMYWESTLKKYLLERWGSHQARWRKKLRKQRERQRRLEAKAKEQRERLERERAKVSQMRDRARAAVWNSDDSESDDSSSSSSLNLSSDDDEEEEASVQEDTASSDDELPEHKPSSAAAAVTASATSTASAASAATSTSSSSSSESEDAEQETADAPVDPDELMMEAQGLPRIVRSDVLQRLQQGSFRSLPLAHKVWIFTQLVSDGLETKRFRQELEKAGEAQTEIARQHREEIHEAKQAKQSESSMHEHQRQSRFEHKLEKSSVRMEPLGYDRWFQRYWIFPECQDRIWIELPPRSSVEDAAHMRLGTLAFLPESLKAKQQQEPQLPTGTRPDIKSPTAVDDGRRSYADDQVLQRRQIVSEPEGGLSALSKHLVMYGGATAWGFYDQPNEVNALVNQLDPRGEREHRLLEQLTGSASTRADVQSGRLARVRGAMVKREEDRTAALAADEARRSRRLRDTTSFGGPSYMSYYNSLHMD